MKNILVALFMMFNMVAFGQEDFFEQFEWKNRIALVFGDDSEALVNKQIDELTSAPEEIADRDLMLFYIGDEFYEIPGKEIHKKIKSSEIRNRYEVDENEFRFILLGKDGGVKFNKTSFVKNQTLFAIIDTMPMRQREMRQNK